MRASYKRLRDGTWGLTVQGQAAEGARVEVAKRDGSTRNERVGRVLWRGRDRLGQVVTLTTIAAAPKNRRYVCDECGECVTPDTQCWETGLIH